MHASGCQSAEAFKEAFYAEIVLELQSVFAAVAEKPGKLHCGAAEKKRPVCLGMVHRVCRRKLADLEAMGFPVTFRGQPLKISKTWCWKMMLTLGYTSRRRSKIRPTSVEADILNCFPDVFCYAYEPKVQK